MDMSNFKTESHVAQQSRRDKLRVQHLEDFPNNLEQGSSVHPGFNPDLVQVRNVRNANLLYDPTVISSGIIHVSTNSNVLPPQKDTMLHQELRAAKENRQMPTEESSFSGMSHSVLSKLNASSKVSSDPQGCGNWKSVDSRNNSCDWMVGYASGLAGRESNQNPMFVGEVLSNNAEESNISAATQCLKPNYFAYHNVQFTLSNPGSEISSQESKKHYGELHFVSPSLYQNALQDVVTTASIGTQGQEVASLAHQNVREAARGSWIDYCGNQANPLHFDNAGSWMNRPLLEHCQQWGGELGFLASKSNEELKAGASDATTQGLSLSLSSNPTSKNCGAAQFTEARCGSDGFHSNPGEFEEPQDLKALKPGLTYSMQNPYITSKGSGKSLQDTSGKSTYVHRHASPLGPFTGYATILKNSTFLKPAQELLDEFCHMTNSKLDKVCETSDRISGDVSASASADAANAVDMEAGAIKGNNLGASFSTFYSSNEIRVDVGIGSSSGESCRPEYHQKKAKLLYLQEEVCKRYKLYYQQMQMVVFSFESVAGLSAAAPYISLALKTVESNFRCLRNAISDHIKHISRALGEDLLSPTTGISSNKGDVNISRLKYVDQKSAGGVNMGFLEPQQHGWRSQRGLPERAVAILRAWLFEHFLHPYPTDTDKHMLATQTGLSRNQVSNWFINARVRVWKPMVEEIHMLESKGLAEGNQNWSKSDGKLTSKGGTSRPNEDQSINSYCINAVSDKQLACSDMLVPGIAGDAHDAEHWNHEKRSKMDLDIPASLEGSLMGFAPHQQSRLEMGGLGAVSLTLGLRHGVESAQVQQHQQRYQRQEDQLRQQFGGQMIHDFTG